MQYNIGSQVEILTDKYPQLTKGEIKEVTRVYTQHVNVISLGHAIALLKDTECKICEHNYNMY